MLEFNDLEGTLLQALLDNIPDTIYFKDHSSKFIRINKAQMKVLGVKQMKDAIGKTDFDFFLYDHAKDAFEDEQEIIRTGKPVISKMEKIRHSDGQFRYFSTTKIPFYKDGKIIGTIGISRDMTETVTLQTELGISELKFKTLFESANDAIFLIKDGVFIECNPKAISIFGLPKEKIIGKKPQEFSPLYQPNGLLSEQEVNSNLKMALDGELQTFYWKHLRSDGSEFDTEISLNAFELDGQYFVQAIVRDISIIRKAENDLKTSEEKFRRIADNSPAMIFRIDILPQFHISFISPATIDFTGYAPLEFYKDPSLVLKIIHPDDLATSKKILDGAVDLSLPFDMRWLHRNGDTVWCQAQIVPIYNYENEIIGYEGVAIDITSLKKAEMALKESEKKLRELNAAKDKFFSIVAHDLRSPFNSLVGFTELLSESYDEFTEEEKKIQINTIRSVSDQTFKLLENLLDWASSQTGHLDYKPEVFDLSEIVTEIIGLLHLQASNKKVALYTGISSGTKVFADVNMIQTIFRNLINNAIKFSNMGGKVWVVAKQKGTEIEISINDTGVGISEENVKKLFRIDEKFKTPGTQSEKGTGLGLLLCKEFVEKNGGRIWVESTQGFGSTFSFTLPARK